MKPNEAFDAALKFTLRIDIEGGYTVDQGGPTNHGVTQHMFSSWLVKNKKPDQDVATITDEEIRAFYREIFWDDVKLGDMAELASPFVAIAMFDTAVNTGEGRAVKLLQKIVCPDAMDGVLGPNTIGLTRKALVIDGKDIIDLYLKERWDYYERLAETDKSYEKDLHGYHNRVLELESYLRGLETPAPVVHNNGTDIGN